MKLGTDKMGKGSERQKSLCRKSKKEHQKSKKNIKNQSVESFH